MRYIVIELLRCRARSLDYHVPSIINWLCVNRTHKLELVHHTNQDQ